MTIGQTMLPEYDHEMATTRKCLERFPEGKNDWTPHEKSMPLSRLASHTAEVPSWIAPTLAQDSLDLNPPEGDPYKPPHYETKEALLEAFDRDVAAGREALAAATDEQMMGMWSMLSGGEQIMSMPRIAVVRSFVMNHLIHHRAQLGVYYRLLGIPVPAIYGPSADES